MTIPRNLIGPRVRVLREKRGWTQSAMATRCNLIGWDLSRETLAKIESQFRWVSDCELLCLAIVLNTSPDDLLPSGEEATKMVRTFFRLLDRR